MPRFGRGLAAEPEPQALKSRHHGLLSLLGSGLSCVIHKIRDATWLLQVSYKRVPVGEWRFQYTTAPAPELRHRPLDRNNKILPLYHFGKCK